MGTHHPSLLEGSSLAAPLALSQETVRMHHDPKKASRYENPCMHLEDLVDLTLAFTEPVLSTESSRLRQPEVHVTMLMSNRDHRLMAPWTARLVKWKAWSYPSPQIVSGTG